MDFSSPEFPFESFDLRTLKIISTLSKTLDMKAKDIIRNRNIGKELILDLIINEDRQCNIINKYTEFEIDEIIYTLHNSLGDNIFILASRPIPIHYTVVLTDFNPQVSEYTCSRERTISIRPPPASTLPDMIYSITEAVEHYVQHSIQDMQFLCSGSAFFVHKSWTIDQCTIFCMINGQVSRTSEITIFNYLSPKYNIVKDTSKTFICEFISLFHLVENEIRLKSM